MFLSITPSSLQSQSNKPLQITKITVSFSGAKQPGPCFPRWRWASVVIVHVHLISYQMTCVCLCACVCVCVGVCVVLADGVCHSLCHRSICLLTPADTEVQSTTAGYYLKRRSACSPLEASRERAYFNSSNTPPRTFCVGEVPPFVFITRG